MNGATNFYSVDLERGGNFKMTISLFESQFNFALIFN